MRGGGQGRRSVDQRRQEVSTGALLSASMSVALRGWPSGITAVRTLQASDVPVLSKPIGHAELVAAVEEIGHRGSGRSEK